MRVILISLFLVFLSSPFFLPKTSLASSAASVTETRVGGGEAKVYQSVETTIDGETVKKESSLPGKMELKMEKTGEGKPTITFLQSPKNLPSEITPTPKKILEEVPEVESNQVSFIFSKLVNFFRGLFSRFL